MAPRYALYFTPDPGSAIAAFGARVLGYDIWSGEAVAQADLGLDAARVRAATDEPARYGFHATLKAPFALADDVGEEALMQSAAEFAATRDAVALGRLEVRTLQRFLALMPVAPPRTLADLAAACVTQFDHLRAPLSDADRARRLAAPLTERQRAHLDIWGYPHVLDDFRFHMTLTGPLAPQERTRLHADLAMLWSQVEEVVTIDGLTVAVQPTREGRFLVKAHYPFRAGRPAAA